MCYFVSMTLPAAVDPERVRVIFHDHDINIQIGMSSGDKSEMHVSRGVHCDCDLVYDVFRPPYDRTNDREKKMRKLKQKGWSEAKIERAMAESSAHEEKSNESKRLRHADSAEQWVELIRDVLKSAPYLTITIHWEGSGHTPRQTGQKQRIPLAELSRETLTNLSEDVRYVFVQ